MKTITRIVVIFLLFVMTIPNCYAILCTRSLYDDLTEKAKKIEATYKNGEITLKNVDKDIMAEYDKNFYEPVDGVIKIENASQIKEIDLYAGFDTECVEEYLISIPVKEAKDFDFIPLIAIIVLVIIAVVIKNDLRKRGNNEKK